MNYYDELGVPTNATNEEIRAAFRRKAKKLHPDRNGGDAEKMARANRAYETLSAPTKRLTYDRTGEDAPPPTDKIAQDTVLKNVMEWFTAEHNSGDLIGDVTKRLDYEQRGLLQQTIEGGKVAKRLEKRLKKLKYRGKAHDFLSVSLNFRITQVRQEVERLKDQAAMLDRAKELLKAYEYPPDAPAPAGAFQSIFGS
jgi:curved DNA-binding protein CbpA